MLTQGLYKGKDGEAVRLYVEPEENPAASARCGRPIFDEVLYAEVTSPGQKESSPVFILERKYADEVGISQPERTPKYEQYKEIVHAYRNGTESVDVRGTPLAAWPRMTVALVATGHAAGIYTVEALAALPETRFAAFGPGARSLVEQAKAFCAAAAGNAPTEALAAENTQLRAEIVNLKEMVAELAKAKAAETATEAAETATEAAETATEAAPAPATAAGKGGKTKSEGGNSLPII
jgi:hypothetical protein